MAKTTRCIGKKDKGMFEAEMVDGSSSYGFSPGEHISGEIYFIMEKKD